MQLTTELVREHLDVIDVEGWDSRAATALLSLVRDAIVLPLVRRSGLRGAAAAQAEASGWEAAWESLRQPSARGAENAPGMVWVAVRRAVAAEARAGRPPAAVRGALEGPVLGRMATSPPGPPDLSLDVALAHGHELQAPPLATPDHLGENLELIVSRLVDHGWTPTDARDAVALLAHEARPASGGQPTTRWRWVALRTGLPEWRVRRLACLLLGSDASPGLLALMVARGPAALDLPDVIASLRTTSSRWSVGPATHLHRASATQAGDAGRFANTQSRWERGERAPEPGYYVRIV